MSASQLVEASLGKARRHVRALEKAKAAASSSAGISEPDLAQLISLCLSHHRKQYDLWMQSKIDNFSELPWEQYGVVDVPTPAEISRTPSGDLKDKVSLDAEADCTQPTEASPEDIKARVLRSGGVPALGPAGLAIPSFDPASMAKLTPTASPAAAELAKHRAGDGAAAPASPLLFKPQCGHDEDAETPELPRPRLRSVSAVPKQSPLDAGGLNELQALLAKRRQQSGTAGDG